MSQGTSCKCENKQLVVTMRNCNYSKFNGSRYTPSDYSEVRCLNCGAKWRTKAAFVDQLPNAAEVK